MKVQFSIVFLFLSSWLFGHEIDDLDFIEVENQKQWDQVFTDAQANGQIVFVDAYTDWCGYCHKLDKEVYTDASVIDYFEEHFINVKFDAESEFGYQLAQFYAIDGYPTLLFLTPDKGVFQRIGGFVPAPALKSYGESVINEWSSLPLLSKAYENGTLERESQLELIGILERTDFEKAAEVAKTYASSFTEEDYLDIENIWFLTRFENDLNSRHYAYIASHMEQMIKTHGQSEFNDYMSGVYNDNLQLAIKYGDKNLLQRLTQETLPIFISEAELPSAKFVTESVYFAQREEFESYKLSVNSYMNNHLAEEQKTDFIISTAIEIIENYSSEELILFANQILTQSLKIDQSRFESHALIGYINGLMDNFNQANKSLNEAMNLAKTDEQKSFVSNLRQAVKMMQ